MIVRTFVVNWFLPRSGVRTRRRPPVAVWVISVTMLAWAALLTVSGLALMVVAKRDPFDTGSPVPIAVTAIGVALFTTLIGLLFGARWARASVMLLGLATPITFAILDPKWQTRITGVVWLVVLQLGLRIVLYGRPSARAFFGDRPRRR